MFTIDKGVPLPRKKTSIKDYPFKYMEIGDSFFVKGNNKYKKLKPKNKNAITKYYYHNNLSTCISKACSKYSKEHWFNGFPRQKFSLRAVKGGFRVWRIK